MHCPLPAVGALTAVLVAPLAAQNWAELFPANSPPGLTSHGMAFDLANDRTVLFGGTGAGGVRTDDTWLFDGTTWSQAAPLASPGPRAGHPLAYDLVRSRVVLFGGIGVGTGVLNDTWEWDGNNWQMMAPVTMPPPRLSHPLAYHPGRGTCVTHGGNSLGAGTLTDTWEWNGVDWAQIVTANFPTPLRFASDMAYDAAGNGLVLFSGWPGGPPDTWYFDNVDWVQLSTANVPPGRWDHTMTTDPVRGRVVMFGGTAVADTWEFDGTDWIDASPTTLPAARLDDYLVYDLVRGQVLMFGGDGRDDTWVYQTPAQPGHAAAIPYGEGCIKQDETIYEVFPANTFDLSNTTLQLLPTGTGYAVLQGTPQWFPVVSPDLLLGDDAVSGPLPLGFTLNYPGGSTTDVYVGSNGFVYGQPGGAQGCCNGNAAQLTSGLPRWSGVWSDLNPTAGGSVHFDIDPTTGDAFVTFQNVPEWNQSATVTFQIAFFTSGIVEIRFQACANVNHNSLTGWSPGGGVRDPGPIDLSAITAPVVTGPFMAPLWHRSDLRPVVGNTLSLTTGAIPAGAAIAAVVYGLVEHNPGIDLTSLGMPGCLQYVSLDVSQLALPSAGRASAAFNVPGSSVFAGVQIKTQGAALVPGINPTGAIVSNGLRLTIDVN